MNSQTPPPGFTRYGDPAPGTRIFGWAMLAALAAFMINNVLSIGLGYPGALSAFSEGGAAWIQVAVYVVLLGGAVFYVLRTSDQTLRWDAQKITAFNKWFVRGCFWAVLLTGIVDAGISFMRTESLFDNFISDPDMLLQFGRVQFHRAIYPHAAFGPRFHHCAFHTHAWLYVAGASDRRR